MRPEALSRQTVSLSSDCVAVRDMTDEKTVHMFDSNTGKALGETMNQSTNNSDVIRRRRL